jgi:hypothetical protein
MIKWLKCLFYGHDYGRFIPSVNGFYHNGDTFSLALQRVCKKCSNIETTKIQYGTYYAGLDRAMLEAKKYADKFNNSIE